MTQLVMTRYLPVNRVFNLSWIMFEPDNLEYKV